MDKFETKRIFAGIDSMISMNKLFENPLNVKNLSDLIIAAFGEHKAKEALSSFIKQYLVNGSITDGRISRRVAMKAGMTETADLEGTHICAISHIVHIDQTAAEIFNR